MSDLQRLADGCRIKADIYAKVGNPTIPASFTWVADEIDRLLGAASEPLNCPICAANGWTDPESCDHTKAERRRAQSDGWPDWFPASPADIERGDELFIGGYTWTLRDEAGAKEYKYRDGRWHRLDTPVLPAVVGGPARG